MKIQDAILRLERAGQEHSKTTKKLLEAVAETANKIVEAFDAAGITASNKEIILNGTGAVNLDLLAASFKNMSDADKAKWGGIGCYYFVPASGDRRSHLYAGDPTENEAERLDSNGNHSEVTRDNALMFSRHVANGLLDLISKWIEDRTAQAQRGLDRINAAEVK